MIPTKGGGGAVRPNLSARRCGCGASPGLVGDCEECRRNRLTSTSPKASTVTAHDATRSASASSMPGHDFGRVSVLAPSTRRPPSRVGWTRSS
ncbi:MAG TPA: hypothetical protein VGX48_14090 [Pyrinomonadaceae bacterium]|nr:hypothetical protein [Pyrinomonadaceae bacterium]